MATYKKIKRDKAVFISCWTPFYIQLALTKIFPHLVINERAYQFISCYGFISRLNKGSKKIRKKILRGLRQVSGINYSNQIGTYHLACGDSEIT